VTELLFSYGTLRQPEVQRATFGREIDGRPDAIVGYELDYVTITDSHVIAASGSDRHPILKPTDRPGAAVEGTVFAISEADLAPPTSTRSTTIAASRCPAVRRTGVGLRVRRLGPHHHCDSLHCRL
jgi:hypothetical protein